MYKLHLNFILSILLLLISPDLSAQSNKKYPALLWKISGNGIKYPSYLYGTMHVSNKVAFHLSEQFYDALKGCDLVALETNPKTWLPDMDKYGMLNNFKYSTAYYSGAVVDFYSDAFKIRIPNNKIYANLMAFNPDLINGLLYRNTFNRENFQENTYIDLFIYQIASKLGKSVVSLEDFRQSVINGKLAEIPDEGPDSKKKSDFRYRYGIHEKTEDAYRRGDLNALDSLNDLNNISSNYKKYLINIRNETFVNTIDSIIKNQSIFAGMGAAHLPGEKGVIELLRSKGYVVEPIQPKLSAKSDKKKEEYERIKTPIKYYKYLAKDSLFSYVAPGPLTEIVSDNNLSYSLFVDMVNGSHFSLVRMKTYGPLYGYDKTKIKSKLDSLFYESIPGKIISKDELVSKDYIKIDLTNKLKNGDLHRNVFYITDTEIILFKLGSKEDYVNSNDAKIFFNSVSFNTLSEKRMTFSPPNGGFQVELSGFYDYAKSNGLQTISNAENLINYNVNSNEFNGVIHSYYNDYRYLEEDTFELNIISYNFLNNLNYGLNKRFTINKTFGLPYVSFSGTNGKGKQADGKLIINGIHYYLVYTLSDSSKSTKGDFVNTFKLIDYKYTNKLLIAKDDDFHFTAMDESSLNPSGEIDNDVDKEYVRNIKYTEATGVDTSYKYFYKEKFYYSPSTGEHVLIQYEKYNDYDYRDKAKMVKSITEYLSKNCLCNVRCNQSKESDNLYTYDFLLSDTATTRLLFVKVLIKHGRIYELVASCDSTIGLKGWTKNFIETFNPSDSVIGKPIFVSKYRLLLNDLASKDTVLRKKAVNSLENISFIRKDLANELLYFLEKRHFDSISDYGRASLLINAADYADKRLIEPLKKLYKKYADSVYLQFSILSSLAQIKTQESYDAIFNLLNVDAPLTGDEYYVNDLSLKLYDSLELCANHYKVIMKLTKFEDYKSSMVKLLSDLKNNKLIKPDSYLAELPTLVGDANVELKRHNLNSAYSPYKGNSNDSQELDALVQQMADNILNAELSKGDNEELINYPKSVYYARLLSPYYRTDNLVREYFVKLLKTKDVELLFHAYLALIKDGHDVSDSVITFFCKNVNYRTKMYSALNKMSKVKLFDKKYLSQVQFCEADALSQINLSDYKFGSDQMKYINLVIKDSILVSNSYKSGKIYIFKRDDVGEGLEKWTLVFVHNKKGIDDSPEMIDLNYLTEKGIQDAEYYNKIKREFYLNYRRRNINSYNKSDLFDY